MLAAYTSHKGLRNSLIVGELPSPSVGDDHVLIEAHASSVNPLDWKIYKGIQFLPFKKIVPGHDVAGVITQVGTKVSQFKVGDEVYCCLPGLIGGAYAELVRAPINCVARKPNNLSMQEAAATPLAALTAWQAFKKAHLQQGQSVLIIGASGGVGTFAVQIAKALGAQVTGVCSTGNLDLVRQLGADLVIDYTRESVLDRDEQYDIVFDVVGHQSLSSCSHILHPQGHYITINPNPRSVVDIVQQRIPFSHSGQRASFVSMRPETRDLNEITTLIEAGKVKPVIDIQYDLDAVDEAYTYSELGRSKGKIVINLREPM